MENCLFCGIARGEVPSKIVYQDDDIVAFADINPQAPTHILLMPRQHVNSVDDLTEADSAILGKLFAVAKNIAHNAGLQERGYRLVTNVGKDAGQSVFHLHFHLLGGRKMAWPPG
jgi:histidine triad (HIT) family protein